MSHKDRRFYGLAVKNTAAFRLGIIRRFFGLAVKNTAAFRLGVIRLGFSAWTGGLGLCLQFTSIKNSESFTR